MLPGVSCRGYGWILQDLMRTIVRSFGPADPVGLLLLLVEFSVGGLLVRGDHPPSHVSLVADPPGGVHPLQQSGRRPGRSRRAWTPDSGPGPTRVCRRAGPGSGSFIPARPCLTDLWRMYIKVAFGDSDRPRLDGYPSTPLLAQLGEQIRELIVNGPWCTPWRRPTPYGVMERFLLHP